MSIRTRWLIRRDMPEVLAIEQGSFDEAWSDEDFLSCLRQRNCIGMVAENDERIVGFMVYELHTNRLELLNFAVDPSLRGQGIGKAMIDRLLDKLSEQRRKEIRVHVAEDNLKAHLFFRAMGFECVNIERDYFDNGMSAYWFVYSLDREPVLKPVNRVKEFL